MQNKIIELRNIIKSNPDIFCENNFRSKSIISDIFADDPKAKNILFIAVETGIIKEMCKMKSFDEYDCNRLIRLLIQQHGMAEESSRWIVTFLAKVFHDFEPDKQNISFNSANTAIVDSLRKISLLSNTYFFGRLSRDKKSLVIVLAIILAIGCIVMVKEELLTPSDETSVFDGDVQQYVTRYADNWLKSGEIDLNRSGTMGLYADNVNYYGKLRDSGYIYKHKKDYFKKYPSRSYNLVNEPRIDYKDSDTIKISFHYIFEVMNDVKSINGTAYCELVLHNDGTEWLITSEKGNIIEKQIKKNNK